MLKYEQGKISMIEGDFGLTLPMTIVGGEISSQDIIEFSIKSTDKDIILSKTFPNVIDNKIDFSLTKEESDKLKVGNYIYNIDWFREGAFMNNIKNNEIFQVKDK